MNSEKPDPQESYSIRRALTAAYMLFVAIVSLLPSTSLPETPTGLHADKIGHFVIYAGMAMLCLYSLPAMKRVRFALMIGLSCSAYGGVIECLQPVLQPGIRIFSTADMAANTAGAFLGAILFVRLPLLRKR